MAKNLVIVESPAKAKTINKILGGDFVVKASMGHVRDLPIKKLGVDIAKGFKVDYEVAEARVKVVKELKEAAAKCENVYLAPDPDREGEAIAWHLKAILEGPIPAENFHRVTYNEITPRAVREAFAHPSQINEQLVNAQQARRVLDRIVGYKVSPMLWSRLRRGLSAGRVQSVALRLVCEREDAIRTFVSEPFWIFGAEVRKQTDPRDAFTVRLAKIGGEKADVRSAEQAEAVARDLEGRALRVRAVIPRQISKRAFPPYITSTLQQAGSRVFDFTPQRTMKIAQKLYEGVDLGDGPVGLITYMRTDSFNLSKEAVEDCRGFIRGQYGAEYVPEKPNVYKSRGGAQEAHEAIRPTDVRRAPETLAHVLTPEELRLYGLIWQRFVSSQMSAARIEQRTAEIETVGPDGAPPAYLFRASASEVVFPGYMKVSGVERKVQEKPDKEGEEAEPEVDKLPPLAAGEPLDLLKWLSERKETQPPGRYSEASLIKTLEENGVGRPSTYAQILGTLYDRRYALKERKAIQPTDLGMQVNAFLVQHLNALFDVGFTAHMEELLDEVEAGKVEWTRMLEDFYAKFSEWMVLAKGPPADVGKVRQLLAALASVKDWGPETKRGNRTFGDSKFVESIGRQLEKAARPLSERQLESLGRLAIRYRAQIANLDSVLAETGLTRLLEEKAPEPASPATREKMELLKGLQFDEPVARRGRKFDERQFVDSLERRVAQDQEPTPAQLHVLNRIMLRYADRVPNFDAIRERLNLVAGPQQEDHESAALLALLKPVTEWRKRVSKAGKAFDDKEFYDSLSRQYAQRKSLTPRQKAALKRMARNYAGGALAGHPPPTPPAET